MKYFVYRYNPVSVGVLANPNLAVVCPKELKEKYKSIGFEDNNIFTIDCFNMPELFLFFKARNDISDIFTLDEGLIHIVGILKAIFTHDKQALEVSYAYKDKKIMRLKLDNVINQPTLLSSEELLPDSFVIKPRREASGKGVQILSKIPDYFSNEDYILETVEQFDTMYTCDGIAVDGKIEYFFSHEYIGNILDIKKNYYNIIRTNSNYLKEDFIKRLKKMTQTVLNHLGTDNIHPFHAEFFYKKEKDELSFCEIGKRFGGGNIPLLIKQSFEVDVLTAYWNLINGNKFSDCHNEKPYRISLTIAIFQNGHHQDPPNLPVDYTYFREYAEKSNTAKSLEDLRYLMSFNVKDQVDFEKQFEILKDYLNEQGE